MRTVVIAFAIACATAATADGAQVYDHYDPAALVAHARIAIAEGDLATACVLLSRAGKLAPHDVRVSLAWGDYEAAQNGLPVRDSVPVVPAPPSVTGAKPAGPIPPEPPKPWPAR
jgi:hypothetical protein